MGDDLTDMGIAATAAAAMGREQVVLAHHPEHPLAGNTDATTDPKPSPDLAVSLALPGDAFRSASMATSRLVIERRRPRLAAADPLDWRKWPQAWPEGSTKCRSWHIFVPRESERQRTKCRS